MSQDAVESDSRFNRVLWPLAGCVVTGAGLGLTLTYNLSWLTLVLLVPGLLALRAVRGAKLFGLGMLMGAIQAVILWYWLPDTSRMLGERSWPGLLILMCVILGRAVWFGVFAVVWENARRRMAEIAGFNWRGAWTLVLGASLWVCMEWFHDGMMTSISMTFFPMLAYSQSWNPVMAQLAAFAGMYGVSFWLMLVNLGVAEGVARRFGWRDGLIVSEVKRKGGNSSSSPSPWWSPIAWMALVVILVAGIGLARLEMLDGQSAARSIRVAILQGNIPPRTAEIAPHVKMMGQRYLELGRQANESRPQLIVWTEGAIPWALQEDDELSATMLGITRESQACHLIGSLWKVTESPELFHNSVFVILPDGSVVDRYDKMRVLPFTEQPVTIRWLPSPLALYPVPRHFVPGIRVRPVNSPFGPLAISICNENFYSGHARRQVALGGELLVVVANNIWIKTDNALRQHFLVNAFRAIETGRDVIVANNSGISGLIDRGGRLRVVTPIREAGCWTGSVNLWRQSTWYVKVGNLFVFLCLCLTAGILLKINPTRRNVAR